tara:strand:+ start:64 stop:510 length:447 start_codon:yes stop_codon:yes gene_type:complete
MLQVTLTQNIDTAKTNDSESKGMVLDYITTFEIPLKATKANLSKIVGTINNELFHKMDLYRNMGTRYINCSAPVLIRFKAGQQVFDLGNVQKELQAKLKVGNTAKARRTFAKRMNFLIHEMTRTIEVKHIDDVVSELTAQEAKELVQA